MSGRCRARRGPGARTCWRRWHIWIVRLLLGIGQRKKLTQRGVGPITALAFAATIGESSRLQRGKQVASYLGLTPGEHSSGGKQRLDGISKQGNQFLRQLLVEAAQSCAAL